MCASPDCPPGSFASPAFTIVQNENTGASGLSQTIRVRPFGNTFVVIRFSKLARSCAAADTARAQRRAREHKAERKEKVIVLPRPRNSPSGWLSEPNTVLQGT